MFDRLPKPASLLGVLTVAACGGETAGPDPPPASVEEQVVLPPGFRIATWAANVTRARSLALGDSTVFVGTYYFTQGLTSPVFALQDLDGDQIAERRFELRNGFGTPNGIAWHDDTLYVADEHRVVRIPDVEQNLARPTYETIYDGLPSRVQTDSATDVGHWWRYLEYGPDNRLYVTVGTRWSFLVGAHTANDLNDDPQYSTIVRMNPDGSGFEVFADGVRNSMGLAFHPVSGELWFTDNGPSWPFEDARFYDIPPDELNRAPAAGLHFGFPYVHGRLDDPLIGGQEPGPVQPPEFEFAAHTAPLGLEFYTGTAFPAEYHGALFVAEHGTEATTPAPLEKLHGDRISVIRFDAQGNVSGYEVFADNFRLGSNADYNRRPVDILMMPDGSLLVSDDEAWAIYRIWYEP